MESRPPVTPLPSHRGRHAGIVSIGLLAATTAVVWITHKNEPSKVPVGSPVVAASVPRVLEPPQLAPIKLGSHVATVVVAELEIPRVVAATGAVTFDASRTNHVRTPVAGLFVKPRASSLGRTIRAGETVGVVYSLEVYFATVDLLAQLRDFQNQEQLDRERVRLLRWGMRREQLARIEQSMKPSAALPIIARVTGKVVVEEGGQRQLIDPSMGDLMTITDPSYATIYVEVPVADAELLRVGQTTQVTLGATTRPIAAPIGYISRPGEGDARIVRVDLHPFRLKMPPDVEAKIELARVTTRGAAVPEAAVIRSDGRTLVYVVRGEIGEPRDVRLGSRHNGYVLVEGVATGETIALPR